MQKIAKPTKDTIDTRAILLLLSGSLILTHSQRCQPFTCFVMVQPRQFVSLQPAPSLPRATCLGIAPARFAEDYRQSRPHLRDRQRRRSTFDSTRRFTTSTSSGPFS